jgi:hypothetical protein
MQDAAGRSPVAGSFARDDESVQWSGRVRLLFAVGQTVEDFEDHSTIALGAADQARLRGFDRQRANSASSASAES